MQWDSDLRDYILSLPEVRQKAYEEAQLRWDTGVTSGMMQGNYDLIHILEQILVRLASWYPENHFGNHGTGNYINSVIASRFEWHRAHLEPGGVGTGGTIVGVMAGGNVTSDLEDMVVDMVRSRTMGVREFDFLGWEKKWRGMTKKLLEIAAEIVQTQAASASMTTMEIASSLRMVFLTLHEMQKAEGAGTLLAPQMMPEEAPKTLAPQDSIQNDKVICLECGAEMRQLTTKHLVSHGMNQKEYRKKYVFSMRTPLAAKSLTKARSKAAKKRGLPEKLQKYMEERRQEKAGASKPAVTEKVTASKPKRTRLRKKKAV